MIALLDLKKKKKQKKNSLEKCIEIYDMLY